MGLRAGAALRSTHDVGPWILAAGLVLSLSRPTGALAEGGDLRLSGSVRGSGTRGASLSIRMSVVRAGGWRDLRSLEASLLVDGKPTDVIDFDIEDAQLAIGEQSVIVGTGDGADGTYLHVEGPDVVLTTGGANLEFVMKLDVTRSIPKDARFRLAATDDFGNTVWIERPIVAPGGEGHGFGWGAVLTAVVVALFAGGFVGNMVASHRRPAHRPSVYSAIQRRIDEERQAASAGPRGGEPGP